MIIGNNTKNLMFLILFIFFLSCGDQNIQTIDLCKSTNCNEWQECNKASGNCESKENFCSTNGECNGHNIYCDTSSHTCKNYDLCTGITCQSWEECNINTGNCKTKENSCNINNDCKTNEFCEANTHLCKDKTTFNCTEDIDCDNHGTCVYHQDNAQCKCDEGYYSPTFGHCEIITCATYNEASHNKETAKELTSNSEIEEVCKNLKNFYKFSGASPIINIIADLSTTARIYKNDITEENLIDSKSGNSNFSLNNNDNSTYYLLIINNDKNSNYTISYKDGCQSNSDCFEDAPTCTVNNKCIKACNTNSECGDFTTCNGGECFRDLCVSHDDCTNQNGLAYCMANNHCEYMTNCKTNAHICDAQLDIYQNTFICDVLSFEDYHGCVPTYPITIGENNISFSLTNIFPIWFKYTSNEVASFQYNIELSNSSEFIEKTLYAFLLKNNEELSAYGAGNSNFNLNAKYLEANTYYLNVYPFEFQAITARSHDFIINLELKNETCINSYDCREVLGRSICESDSCNINTRVGGSPVNRRCDFSKNCSLGLFSERPECLDRVNPIDNILEGLCSLRCGNWGHEGDDYCSRALNSSDYYCIGYNEKAYCLPTCSVDSDCIIGLTQGSCIMDNQRNVNVCKFE